MKTLLLLLLFTFVFTNQTSCESAKTAGSNAPQSSPLAKGNRMDKKTFPLQLNEQELREVEISYLFNSQKLNAGFQEIVISGNGVVRLKKQIMINDRTEMVEGKLSQQEIISLLSYFEEESFLGLNEEYTDNEWSHGYSMITLKMKGKSKSTTVVNPDVPQFERIAGAIKVTAGIALPQALNYGFFKNF